MSNMGWGQPSGWNNEPQPGNYGQPPSGWGNYGGPQGMPYRPVLRPGIIPLRPLSLGEILDGALQAVRRNPRAMMGSAAILVLISALITAITVVPMVAWLGSRFTQTQGEIDQATAITASVVALATAAVTGITTLLCTSVLTGMLTTAVGQAVMGRTTTISQLWETTRPRFWRIVGVSLAVGLMQTATVAVPVMLGALGFFISPTAGLLLMMAGFLVGFLGLAIVYTRLSLSVPALVLESTPIGTAVRRSWNLTGRPFWRILGILILSALIIGIIGSAIRFPFQVVMQAIGVVEPSTAGSVSSGALAASMLVAVFSSLLSGIITYPFSAAISTLLYLDTRMRQEGLDIALNEQAQREQPPGHGV